MILKISTSTPPAVDWNYFTTGKRGIQHIFTILYHKDCTKAQSPPAAGHASDFFLSAAVRSPEGFII